MLFMLYMFVFSCNDTATTYSYTYCHTLSLHHAPPISTGKGGELAIGWRPVDGLNLRGAVTYVDAKIKKYSGLNSDGVFTDFAGDRVPFAPKWNASANADYTVPLGASLAVNLGASLTYNSSTQAAIGHDAVTKAVTYIKPFT